MKEIPAHLKKETYTPLLKAVDMAQCQISHWRNRRDFMQLRTSNEETSLKGFDELGCIFVHIPKSAGVTINKVLFGNLGGSHRSVRTYKRVFGPYTFSKYFKFTFVRNPYSRLLSAFRFLKSGGFDQDDRIWAEENLSDFESFEEFTEQWLSEESMMEYRHFQPQYMFVCDHTFEPEVDFIGRFETIDEDFRKICDRLNIRRELKKHNRGPEKKAHWSTYYSEKTLEKVHRIYRKDFELFGYSARVE